MDLEQLKAALERIKDMGVDEITTLKSQVIDYFDQVDAEPTTAENVAILQQLSQAIQAIMSREADIEKQEQQAEADKEAARQIRQSVDADPDAEPDPEAPPTGDDTDADTGDKKEPALVATGKPRSSPSKMNGGRPTSITPTPVLEPKTALVASANLAGKNAGDEFTSRYDLGRTIANTLRGMHRGQSHGRVVVASANFLPQYPPERTLSDNITENAEKMDAVITPQALVATGGICQPVNVDYALQTWATPERPLKSGFAQFATDRGGLTYRLPPTVAALADAIGVWTEATDADPGDLTKPVLAISCPSPITTYVNAITTRLGFGNLQGQFDPDTITANTDLAVVAAARVAELELLTLLQAACVANITSASVLGASRDWFTTIDGVAANYRYVNRLDDGQMLTIVLPNWVKSMIRADRVNELAHDGSSVDPFSIPDAWIDSTLAVRGIKAIWTLDALPVNGEVYPTQQFTGFTTAEPVPSFPAKVVWNLYVEGSIQFLDGGLLNLGVVRDATLDATNDYETFMETFEGLAYRGFSGGALQIVSELAVNGSSSATVTY
jgi:hypothetical protein